MRWFATSGLTAPDQIKLKDRDLDSGRWDGGFVLRIPTDEDELRLAHALLASLGKFWSNNNSADEEKTSRRENPVSWTPLSGSVSGLT
ncbi:hypothetical protein PAPYR_9824 [Paratrimastix pyriformis]|uniref:Uncharacterized protein n=1 Tax=Paratrimastix pyriformis TaxID=342808 RepID=A0ABQ8U7H4_9EUKA|nr:hypothetical protein PAPYR_9824 [Paratrimastix pyriformis]